jgi:hypothetical protein
MKLCKKYFKEQFEKKYLINSKAQEFTVTSLRHYKLSRAYQHLDANHICNVSFNQLKHSSFPNLAI